MKKLLALLLLASPAWAVDFSVEAGQESVLLDIFVADSSSTTGAGLTGLVHNTTDLKCFYHRSNATDAVEISLVTMTAGTWVSGGFKVVDSSSPSDMPGVYQLGAPNAAFEAGASYVTIQCKGASNMVPTTVRVQIAAPVEVASAQADSLPSTAFSADGTAQSATGTTLRLADAETYAADEPNGNLLCITGGTGKGQCRLITDYSNSPTADTATVEPAWTTTPSTNSTYVVVSSGYIPGARTASIPAAAFAPDGTAQSATSTTIRLADAETYAADELNGTLVCITGGTGKGQCRLITDYANSPTADTATVEPAWTTTPSTDSTYVIVSSGYIPGAKTGTYYAPR